MDISRLLGQADASLNPRDLTKEELDEMDRQLRMQAPPPGEEVIRKLQRATFPDMKSDAWWQYPLLNQPYTRSVPQPKKYGPRQFQTIRPVLLDPKQLAEQNATLRKFRDQEQAAKLQNETNPLARAWKYYMEAEAY